MMGLKIASLTALSSLACLSGSHARLIGNASTPIVDLGYAQYKGNTSLTGTNVFYGIQYAQAPTGELRWRPPQDIEAHNNFEPTQVLNAESPGPSCVQGTPAWRPPQRGNLTVNFPVTGEEDCLRLDVVVPTQPQSSSLPVMVMIHGGGFTQGSSYALPGSTIVDTARGSMIYVSLQYRLGAFGFLSGAGIRENGQANVGLLDQRSALNWVQRNIRAFGGDPAKVTIIGGSAGGSSGELRCLVGVEVNQC
jgi:carboxylesterase type B